MTKLFKNEYCPTTIEDYIGSCETIQYYLERSLNNQESGKSFILYGKPGTGKSTIVKILANHYNMDIHIINASDDRNKINGNIIHTSSLLNDKKKLIVFDECDGLNDKTFKDLSKIISNYSPIIIICNDINKIPGFIKSKCYTKEIVVDRFSLKNLAKKIIKTENLNIDNDKLNKALINITSYRGLLDFLQFDYVTEIGSFSKEADLKDIITFTNDNSENPSLISLADIYLNRYQNGYNNGKIISKYIIDSIDVKSSDYPRTYKLLGEIKREKQGGGKIKILGFK